MMHLFCNSVCLFILAFEHILTSSLTHMHVILQNPSTESMGWWGGVVVRGGGGGAREWCNKCTYYVE